jgi:hypothetical protein
MFMHSLSGPLFLSLSLILVLVSSYKSYWLLHNFSDFICLSLFVYFYAIEMLLYVLTSHTHLLSFFFFWKCVGVTTQYVLVDDAICFLDHGSSTALVHRCPWPLVDNLPLDSPNTHGSICSNSTHLNHTQLLPSRLYYILLNLKKKKKVCIKITTSVGGCVCVCVQFFKI